MFEHEQNRSTGFWLLSYILYTVEYLIYVKRYEIKTCEHLLQDEAISFPLDDFYIESSLSAVHKKVCKKV